MDKSIFLHGSTGKDLVQSTVFELFDLDLPAELLRILELGLRCSSRTDTANDRLIAVLSLVCRIAVIIQITCKRSLGLQIGYRKKSLQSFI